ncbi:MAG: hypothetical protein AAGC55_22585, partial [Myxococcota bacterium]
AAETTRAVSSCGDDREWYEELQAYCSHEAEQDEAPAAPALIEDDSRVTSKVAANGKGRWAKRMATDIDSEAGRALIVALNILYPDERLRELGRLYILHPDHRGVLYHFAIQSALSGDREVAREAGQRLREVSPQRYYQLRHLAQQYWPDSESIEPGWDEDSVILLIDPKRGPGAEALAEAHRTARYRFSTESARTIPHPPAPTRIAHGTHSTPYIDPDESCFMDALDVAGLPEPPPRRREITKLVILATVCLAAGVVTGALLKFISL